MYHLSAVKSVPVLIKKLVSYPVNKNRRIQHGKQVKDGTTSFIIQSL